MTTENNSVTTIENLLSEVSSLKTDVAALIDTVTAHGVKQEAHTTAVNQFGEMLQYVVNTVAEFGNAVKSQGVGGLFKMMGNGNNNG